MQSNELDMWQFALIFKKELKFGKRTDFVGQF